MRLKSLVLAVPLVLMLAFSTSGNAATIVQNIPGLSQDLGDFTPFDIKALPFDPANGTLQSVSVEIIGTYQPIIFHDLGPFPATVDLNTRLFVFAENGGGTLNFALPTQTGVPVTPAGQDSGQTTGVAAAVDHIFNFTDVSAFITGIAGQQLLIGYGFRASDGLPGTGGASDLTNFNGSAILTYTFDVPEPATLMIFAIGLFGLALSRRRSS
ncbi:PEP-CTERM sorting domain-containing protein [Undibacterium sp. TJN25]|uniref:PEP-CTERM sorting domain-containing protein n=1 Tax=Undibacterium sp. TJN25 TaxID=3413056 RepID=UPI003BF01B14